MRSSLILSLATLALLAQPVAAERICVEEAGGVCLKYQEAPRVSPAQAAEQGLGLSREDRRAVQAGLSAAGVYDGALDGALGPQSRRSIRAWQRANGAAETGYLTAGQVATLKALVPAQPVPAAPAPETTEATAPEPAQTATDSPTETSGAHPQPGRVYTDGHTTIHGGRIEMKVRRVDDANVEIILTLEDGQTLSDSCIAPIKGEVTCYMRRPRWNMILISGELPRLVATETEAMPQVKIRADKEVFEFW